MLQHANTDWSERPAQHAVSRPQAAPEAPAHDADRRALWVLVAILAAGAVLRLALWFAFQGHPLTVYDETEYNLLAVNLVEHSEFSFVPGEPLSQRPPLFPALLAGVYKVCGLENYQAMRLLQAGISLVTVVLVYLLGRELFSRKVALWAAGLTCFYPSLVFYNNLLLSETLFTCLLVATCYATAVAYRRRSLRVLALAGVLMGFAALTRSVIGLFPPVFALFLLLTWDGRLPRRLLAGVTVVVAAALVIAPWSIRNSMLEKTFVMIDTMGGRNFMMGNYEYTPLYRAWETIEIQDEHGWNEVFIAATPAGAWETQGQKDKLAAKYGLRYALGHPGQTLLRDTVHFFDFWGLERELVGGGQKGFFGNMPKPALLGLAAVIVGGYVVSIILAIFGAVMAPTTEKRLGWYLLLVMAFICGIHTVVFGHSRYHLPLMPLVLLFSASALVNYRAIWERRKGRHFVLAAALVALLMGGWVWGLVGGGDLDRLIGVLHRGT